MTLSTTTNRVSFAGNGVTTVFSFPYYFLANADLVVILRSSAGVETVKTITTHYTVSGAGAPAGGSVTMITAPATGETLTIYRDPAITQDLDLVENDPMPAEEIEERVDKLTMIVQRHEDRLDRAVTLSEGYAAAFTPNLPATLTAGKSLRVNDSGNGIALGATENEIANAQTYATNAANSASAAATSAAASAASNPSEPATSIVFADSPYTVAPGSKKYKINTSGGAVTMNLPAAASWSGSVFYFMKTTGDANAVTVDGNGSETINGALTQTITQAYGTLALVSTGTEWLIIANSEDEAYTAATATAAVQTNVNAIQENFLLNSNFDLWQRGTSVTVANTVSTYLADRWYCKNSLGTDGVITYSRETGASDGALYAAKLLITTAPTASQANGCELYQTLENKDSMQLYNKTASFTVKVKAFGNVNQCGIQFFYKTTEAKVDTAIGSEVTAAVNTSTFTSITISGQALGTSMTTSGVIGVRIRPTAVSSGNLYDLNNGFSVEQAMLNLGSTIGTFHPAGKTLADEISMCQRYYEKSYDLAVNPGTNTGVGKQFCIAITATALNSFSFQVRKRVTFASGTFSYWKTNGSASNIDVNGTDRSIDSANMNNTCGDRSIQVLLGSSATVGEYAAFQWAFDAEI